MRWRSKPDTRPSVRSTLEKLVKGNRKRSVAIKGAPRLPQHHEIYGKEFYLSKLKALVNEEYERTAPPALGVEEEDPRKAKGRWMAAYRKIVVENYEAESEDVKKEIDRIRREKEAERDEGGLSEDDDNDDDDDTSPHTAESSKR